MRINQETKTISHAASIIQQQSSESAGEQANESAIDATLQDSFPASDPPSWTLGIERTASNADFPSVKETA
jgi:hypothetical protein